MQTHVERPADSAGELYFRTPVTPEEAFQAIGRLRKEARDEIDRLIRFLDKTDDYVSRELEEEVDAGPCDDNELDGDDTPDGRSADDEPLLGSGSTGELSSQASWATTGSTLDLEDEHDGAEPEDEGGCGAKEDDEPSLGWPERVNQAADPGSQSGDDRELQDHAPVKPQGRTRLGKGIHAAPNFIRGNRVLGLTAGQKAQFNEKRRAGRPGMVS